MNPEHPTWYRHIPSPDAPARRVRRGRWVRPTLFWTLSIVFAVGLACVVPFGFLLVLPFMIGFLAKVKETPRDERRNEPDFDPRHPYDNL